MLVPDGTLSETCNQILVECYDGADVGPWTGLDFIRGYSTARDRRPPPRRSFATCRSTTRRARTDSGPYFLLHAGCAIGVRAKIDFGTGTTDPRALARTQVGVDAVAESRSG